MRQITVITNGGFPFGAIVLTRAYGRMVAPMKVQTCMSLGGLRISVCVRRLVRAKGSAMTKRIDYTGQKFYCLTCIEPTDKPTYKSGIVWKMLCDCGNIAYLPPLQVIKGRTKSCGHLKERPWEQASARVVWKDYKRNDKLRGFDPKGMVDFNAFYALSQRNCAYCNSPPSQVYKAPRTTTFIGEQKHFTYNGLDRVDNTKGHTLDNVVPCCFICNRMKGTKTVKEFYADIRRIAEYQKQKREALE